MSLFIKQTILFTFISLSTLLHAQVDSNKLFTAPLNIPMYLAGNFGEIRGGHFHAGIDIKTQQVEGLPVLAAADGYVSRVKVSLGGYGNAIYITHPNGYTTAYGHLQTFNDNIKIEVLEEQYTRQKFTVELFFTSERLPVKQGDTIALSGNSGGSGGPHLHFEIRKTKGAIPQNPLKFGFDIKDDITPIMKNLAIYPLNDTSLVNGKTEPLFIPLKKAGTQYVLADKQKISARGVVGFGLEAIDKLNGANNRCGVYNITLRADSTIIYSHQMDEISFTNTRYIQTHVDFYETKKNTRRIQKSYLTTYNPLKIYKNVQNKGLVYFSKYGHELNYHITDVYGNETSLDFLVSVDSTTPTPELIVDTSLILPYDEASYFEAENIKIQFPKYSLYENLRFKHSEGDTIQHAVSPIHNIQNLYTPLQKKMTVSIKTPEVDKALGDKFIAVSLNEKHKMIAPEGGKYADGWVTFKTRSFGPYTIMMDTVAPVIKPINFNSKQNNFSTLPKIILQTEDNLSGVKTYNAYVDGVWHLLEYDYKTGLIWIELYPNMFRKGDHKLEIKVGDSVNNFKAFTFNFIW